MKSVFLAEILSMSLLVSASAPADDAGDPAYDPKALLRIVTALESSGIDGLVSFKSEEKPTTYHLKRAEYLGTVKKDGKVFTIAQAFYIRSDYGGDRQTPPARGHSYVIILDPDSKLVSRAYVHETYTMSGDRLMVGDMVMADFQANDIQTRHNGYLLEGGPLLPYPFADKITDAQWESGNFKR